jgi:signal transduction histidine kinase/large-conductance mechanosensitive channel
MLTPFIRWFQAPIFPDDEDKTRSAILLSAVLNTFILTLPVLFVGPFLGGDFPRLAISQMVIACTWLLVLGDRFIMGTGRITTAAVALVTVIFIGTTLAICNIGTIRAPATSFYILAIVMAGLTIHRRAIAWVAGLSAVTVILLVLAEQQGFLPTPTLKVTFTQVTTLVVIFAIISILLYLAVERVDQAMARVSQELAERQRTEERLEVLNEIDRGLLTANSLPEIAKGALIRIRRLIPCPRANVTLFDLEKKMVTFLASDFDGPGNLVTFPISFQEFGQYIIDELQQNRPYFIHDAQTNPYATAVDRRLLEIGIHTWVSIPLLYQKQLIGAVNLGRGKGHPFTTEEAEIVHDIANELAIAIQQTRLYQALQSELAERKQLIAQLEASNAELERFTYTVSHDLRNPLVTIKGFLGMLDKDLREGRQDRIQSDFQRISNAADKMHILLGDLLELSRIGRIINPPEEVDLVKLAQEAVETLDARIRSTNVRVSVSPDLPIVFGDRLRLREVLENLIDNAAKYTEGQPDPSIEIGSRMQNGEQVIFVKDNGIGIESKYFTRIFGLFEKLNPKSEGTGIGLTLVKRIIEVHGGRIWVESALERGTTFYFTLGGKHES